FFLFGKKKLKRKPVCTCYLNSSLLGNEAYVGQPESTYLNHSGRMESREFMASSSRYVSNGGGNVGGGGGGVSASSFNEYNNGNEPYNPYTTMLTPHSPCHQSSPRHYGGPAPMGMPSINHQPMNSMDASQTTRVVDFCGLIPPESDFYLQCKNGKNNEIENVKYNPVVQSLNNLTIDDRRTTSEYPSWSTSNHYDGNEMSNMSYYQNQFPNNDQGLQRESDSSLSVPFTSRQRRWSDGNESKYTKPEVESYQQSNQQYLIKTDNSNNPYYCDCLNCKQKYAKLRPKVSFGPSMMYPMEPQVDQSGLFYPELPSDQMGKNKNANSPWSKLTTELLPLDTQIPLQMMSDSALVCNII
ncbi:hypothetical protein BLOT_003999, partial [Blomia tropicalis]